jgi:hypothetical protein
MDPITVIVGALSAVSGALGDQAIKDGYAGFKALIVKKFGASNPRLEGRIDDFVTESDAAAREASKVLAAKALRDAGVDKDDEVVNQATALQKHAEAVQTRIGGVAGNTITATDSTVTQVGGNVGGSLTIGAQPKAQS